MGERLKMLVASALIISGILLSWLLPLTNPAWAGESHSPERQTVPPVLTPRAFLPLILKDIPGTETRSLNTVSSGH